MADIILLHGAWHGEWSWKWVRTLLEQDGHHVFTPTFTGLGNRTHLLNTEVGLHTHIQDICALIKEQNLQKFILVGHSYAGLVIPGIIQHMRNKEHGPIEQVIYLDGVLVPFGQCWSDSHDSATRQRRLHSAITNASGVSVFPAPSVAALGVSSPEQIHWADSLLTAHPARTYTDMQSADPTIKPSIYIDCTNPALAALQASKAYARCLGWTYLELDAGHDCMISHPQQTADILKRCFDSRATLMT